jgi:hypothetical protein
MTIYNLALFLHIAGGFGLVAAFTVETIGLRGLRRASQAGEALTWLSIGRTVQRLAPASLGVILITGLYLMANYGGPRGWVVVALGSFLLIAAVGAVGTGLRMARIGPAVGQAAGTGSGPLPDALQAQVRDPIMVFSLGIRIGILLGILYLMTIKPSPLASLLVVGLAAVAGAVAAALVSSGTAGAAPVARPRSASHDAR